MTLEFEDDPGVSLYVGSISDKVTEDLLWELFVQAGPVTSVKIPVDVATRVPKGFAFVQFAQAASGDYAIKLLHDTPLCGRNLVVRSSHRGNANSAAPPAAANTYAAAKSQLEGLQQQMIAKANAMRPLPAHASMPSPSLLGGYVRGGGGTSPAVIPYHTPRRDAPAAATATSGSPLMPAHSRYARSPDRPHAYGSRPASAERQSSHPGRGHVAYDRPAERRYSRDEQEAAAGRHSHDAGRVYARASYPSHDVGYATGRGGPLPSSQYDGHQQSHSQGPQHSFEHPSNRRGGPSSSSVPRYHPYSRAEPAAQRQYQHPSAPPDQGNGNGQYRQYNNARR